MTVFQRGLLYYLRSAYSNYPRSRSLSPHCQTTRSITLIVIWYVIRITRRKFDFIKESYKILLLRNIVPLLFNYLCRISQQVQLVWHAKYKLRNVSESDSAVHKLNYVIYSIDKCWNFKLQFSGGKKSKQTVIDRLNDYDFNVQRQIKFTCWD
mgnify:CR=1 FL=1